MSETHYTDPDYASASEVAEIESLMAGPLRLRDLLDAPRNARQDAAVALVLLGMAVVAAFASAYISVVAFTLASIIFVDRVDCWLRADRECLGCRYQTQRFAHRQHRSWLKLTYGGQVGVMLVLVLVGALSWDLSVGAVATVAWAPVEALATTFADLLIALFGAPARIIIVGTVASTESLLTVAGPFTVAGAVTLLLVAVYVAIHYTSGEVYPWDCEHCDAHRRFQMPAVGALLVAYHHYVEHADESAEAGMEAAPCPDWLETRLRERKLNDDEDDAEVDDAD